MTVETAPIREIRYDERQTRLSIFFETGEEYIFVGVPASVHRALTESKDLAAYLGERILERYPYNILDS